MIIVTVEINVKPDMREEGLAASRKMAQATRTEAGCHTYQFHTDIEDPNKFFLFELWDSQEALAAHQQTAHVADLAAQLPKILASDLVITRYSAEPLQSNG